MEYGDRSTLMRVNVAPHAFLFPFAQIGQEIKENVCCVLYTSCRQQPADPESAQVFQPPPIQGVHECQSDWGKLNINKSHFLTNQNLMEVHLHPTENGSMAVSPNNFVFLMDMS